MASRTSVDDSFLSLHWFPHSEGFKVKAYFGEMEISTWDIENEALRRATEEIKCGRRKRQVP